MARGQIVRQRDRIVVGCAAPIHPRRPLRIADAPVLGAPPAICRRRICGHPEPRLTAPAPTSDTTPIDNSSQASPDPAPPPVDESVAPTSDPAPADPTLDPYASSSGDGSGDTGSLVDILV
jgi:hypothetical protein